VYTRNEAAYTCAQEASISTTRGKSPVYLQQQLYILATKSPTYSRLNQKAKYWQALGVTKEPHISAKEPCISAKKRHWAK